MIMNKMTLYYFCILLSTSKMFYTIIRGIKYAFKDDDGKTKHSLSLPAVVHPNGTKEWWLDGVRHRKNGPAILFDDGGEEWWVNGVRHRKNGPAVSYANGHKEWWYKGSRHREDDAAVEYNNGDKEFWEYGTLLFEHKNN